MYCLVMVHSVCVLGQDHTPIPGVKLSLSVHVCAYLPLTNISYLSYLVHFPTYCFFFGRKDKWEMGDQGKFIEVCNVSTCANGWIA
jgi:peptidoglycan/LPS O-acetylase OafA/YrhL